MRDTISLKDTNFLNACTSAGTEVQEDSELAGSVSHGDVQGPGSDDDLVSLDGLGGFSGEEEDLIPVYPPPDATGVEGETLVSNTSFIEL
jgi:hypothetical protein